MFSVRVCQHSVGVYYKLRTVKDRPKHDLFLTYLGGGRANILTIDTQLKIIILDIENPFCKALWVF